jgi:hypothetical protein
MPHASAESIYLVRVHNRLREVLGESLIGLYAGGSWALGDYLPGRSDLDLAAVVHEPLPLELEARVVARLHHESLPCPGRLLELVVYEEGTARSGSATAEFELNLNTGATTPLAVDTELAPDGIAPHWFVIDRSVLSQGGIAMSGPPAEDVFAAIPAAELMPVVADSVRWHREHPVEPGDAVLNGCRALRYADEGRWSSKPAAGQWAAQQGLACAELVTLALQARTENTALDRAEVGSFLRAVEARLRRART